MLEKRVRTISDYVRAKMSGEATGHDWFHVQRVYKTATKIAEKEERGDRFLIQATALLHDIGDWKVNTSDKSEEQILDKALEELDITGQEADAIKDIILNMSFSKNVSGKKKLSLEGKIVQDADRLEALGAIGIARAFAYGGKANREIYNPDVKPKSFKTLEEYRTTKGHTINHFYEKLFKIKNQLNTKTAKAIATKREKFMKNFLKEFYAEWDGKL